MPQNFQMAWVAAFLVVPGYVFIFFLEAARVRKRRDPMLMVIESLAMSLIVWVSAWFFIGPSVMETASNVAAGSTEWRQLVGPTGVLLLLPAMAGIGVGAVFRKWPGAAAFMGLRATLPRAWDHSFDGRPVAFVRVTLTSGAYLAGIWGSKSLASPYPEEGDLYLEVQYEINELGVIGRPIPGSEGVWVPAREIRVLEFLKAQEESG